MKQLLHNPNFESFNGIPNVNIFLEKIAKVIQSDRVKRLLNVLETNRELKFLCDVLPSIASIILAGIAAWTSKSLGVFLTMGGPAFADLWGKFMDDSVKGILRRFWDAIPWHWLWNPWIVAGIITLATSIWELCRVYAKTSTEDAYAQAA